MASPTAGTKRPATSQQHPAPASSSNTPCPHDAILNGVNSKELHFCDQLMERMAGVVPIPGEEDFFVRPDTLRRFLRARNWNVDDAEKILKGAVEWRRTNDAIHMDCRWCHDHPGYHSIRQVGFDLQRRPVIYACFTQTTANPTVEDIINHCTYLIENAQKTMASDVSTWVFILDCRGMTLPQCNPKIGYGLTQVFANFYPERLGLVICLHHNPIFHGVWNAIKVFLHDNTVAKMHLIRSKKKIEEEFTKLFDDELKEWLLIEMKLNKEKPLSLSQQTFWKAPIDTKHHDPRGCPSYVKEFVDTFLTNTNSPLSVHKPHPNIVDELKEVCKPLQLHDKNSKLKSNSSYGMSEDECAKCATVGTADPLVDDDSESEEANMSQKFEHIEISKEYQVPSNAERLADG
ncbi:hypothetical protein HELRODRAFT_190791 [Helobdella robusta]|uniref:CRAL-TRIO domain-containing protein n=1 Tax=Helobdella robusta TaxID=6412 RepID=T1FSA7_HELRO|nr:hypothetical protein HELRODRAFT_190791 [Helobdella robusta]ESO08653.1 hypothetical protein HELRODRAFT_190791 [Helobdella robusta]